VNKTLTVIIPYAPMPKKRPRVTKNGTYMPPEYVEWRTNVAEVLALQGVRLEGRVKLTVVFGKKQMWVTVTETTMTRHGRADIDNLTGSLMDALQDSGVIANDRDVVTTIASYSQG